MLLAARRLWRPLALLTAIFLALGTILPTAAQAPSRILVGRIEGTPPGVVALVALIVDADGAALVYACSDDDAWNQQHSRWFTGRVTNGTFSGQAPDGTMLTAQLQGGQASGTIGGQTWTASVVSGGTAGLYRGGTDDNVVATIELPDGTRAGRVWSRSTATPVATLSFRGNTTVEVQPGGVMRIQSPQQNIDLTASFCNSPFC